jgi:hypothetical protein
LQLGLVVFEACEDVVSVHGLGSIVVMFQF